MMLTDNKSHSVKRVLMTTDAVGGVWNYTVELASGYVKRNIGVIIATMGPLPDYKKREQISGLKNVELFESSFKLEWMDNPWEDVEEAAEWLLEIEIIYHPDIIHLNGFVHGALPWNAPVIVAGHSCVCSWYEQVKKSKISADWHYYRKKVGEGLMGADFVVAPSRWMLERLNRYYGNLKCSKVIYNGRSAPGINIFEKENIIFSAGRIWDEGKNIEKLMLAAGKIDWPVFIAGDYGEKKLNFKNVNLLGPLSSESVFKWMSRASIFVMPSIYEPFGLSILEAALAHCALVLGNIDSLKEIWSDAAVYVNTDNPNAIKDAVDELIVDKKLLLKYANRAHQRALMFSSGCMIENYLDLYESLLNKDSVLKSLK